MSLSIDDFSAFHQAVHKRPPFLWQTRLLRQVVEKRGWPRTLDLPTGSGKTTCVDIALFALALDADSKEKWCPRRIAMVVDRRVVVDQVAERGRRLLRTLVESDDRVVLAVKERLCHLGGEDDPLGVFTLRGGIPKDDGWARNPTQPLILASTVDQIGSRLLVQGYGVSRGMKPVHAGLLGNDTLLLLDEVHLSNPFKQTLEQLDRLRTRFQGSGLPTRFIHAFLSATPGDEGSDEVFRLSDEERSPDSALGKRLHASKPTRLLKASGRTAVEARCVDEARVLMERHDVVAVVMNRVDSARTAAKQLKEHAVAEVVLLTGRMRPLDRDDVLARWLPRIRTGRERGQSEGKLVLVGTQSIEAGADFDFDALVTEAASLDALRQRFGRVDRLGLYEHAEGVIVLDAESSKDDPVYGEALKATWKWLEERAGKKKTVDFGVSALAPPDTHEALGPLLAPKEDAPVLLPAYLDLWMQTSPEPARVPDVSLFLHGKRSGPADVTILWRADLSEAALQDDTLATEIVGAVRPSSLEAVSVPVHAARRWLKGAAEPLVSDAEGAAALDEGEEGLRSRRALRWRGDDSQVIWPSHIRPGDTLVVPTSYGGLFDGNFDPGSRAPITDLAERAAFFGRGEIVLRTHPAILAQYALPALDGEDDPAGVLEAVAEGRDGWQHTWLQRLRRGFGVATDTGRGWQVLEGRRLKVSELRKIAQDGAYEYGELLTTDEDDSPYGGRPVSLRVHSGDVELKARGFAQRLDLPETFTRDLALAGWLHDIGKADRRFQVLLRGGSELALFEDETPLAKSGMPSGARFAQRKALEASGYPKGGRHEMQSVAMIEANEDKVRALDEGIDLELVKYLVGSHHGWARPFAPAVVDDVPVRVQLEGHVSETFGDLSFAPCTSNHGLHRLDAGLAERFWRLVERFGWQGLCWLEAILRLADHRASEAEEA